MVRGVQLALGQFVRQLKLHVSPHVREVRGVGIRGNQSRVEKRLEIVLR